MFTQFHLELHQVDVKIAILNCQLLEEVYMSRPRAFEVEGKEHMVRN